MHINTGINTDALTTAVAIATGMNMNAHWDVVSKWNEAHNMGAFELYAEVAELAALSHELMTDVAACADFAEVGFPGVYAYEVDEIFGVSIMDRIESDIGSLEDPQIKLDLGQLALAFFDRGGFDIPITKAIIERLTGYVRPE